MHACDRQTDGQTDGHCRILIAKPRLHCMQRGNKCVYLCCLFWSFVNCVFFSFLHCTFSVFLSLFIVMFATFSMCSSCTIFTARHAMQTRSSDENSVRPSVTRVHCDKTIERSVQIYIPYERTFISLFWEEEWLVGGDPFYVKFWVNRPPLERNRRFSTNNRL